MKEFLIVSILFFASLGLWVFVDLKINTIQSEAPVAESIGKFTQTNVRIDIDYLKKIPAYEPR